MAVGAVDERAGQRLNTVARGGRQRARSVQDVKKAGMLKGNRETE